MNTATAPLDLETARRLMAQAVDEQPDLNYTNGDISRSCFYVALPELRVAMEQDEELRENCYSVLTPQQDDPRETTGCLVGVVLERHGETRQRFTTHSVYGLRGAFPDMFANWSAQEYLSTAQSTQDRGGTWREALARAEEWYAGWVAEKQ